MAAFDYYYSGSTGPVRLRRVDSKRLVFAAKDQNPFLVARRLLDSSRIRLATRLSARHLVIDSEEAKFLAAKAYPDIRQLRSVFSDELGQELALTDDVLIGTEQGADLARVRERLRRHGSIVGEAFGFIKLQVSDPSEDSPLHVANELSAVSGVRWAVPNSVICADFMASGPSPLGNQWHLDNVGQFDGLPGADARVLDAWAIMKGRGDSRVRVVVVDSGVDLAHPDLKQNLLEGWDFDDGDSEPTNPSPFDPDSAHGTACAGLIAASGGPGCRTIGVAPGCRIVPVRAYRGHCCDEWAAILNDAGRRGEILSCSWRIADVPPIKDALTALQSSCRDGRGIPAFFPTGNDGRLGVSFPACLESALGVGASTNRDNRSSTSNYGEGLDFLAPGGRDPGIETTDYSGINGYNRNSEYCVAGDKSAFSGTSAATAVAAGVAALVLSVAPRLSALEVGDLLRGTADRIGGGYDSKTQRSEEFGYGRLNAARAVEEAMKYA